MRWKKKHSIPPYLRPRPDYWPDDIFCRGYFSSVIPKFWHYDACWENKISSTSKHLLHESTTLLQGQYHEVSPVISETMLDKRQAERDARAGIQDFNRQGRLDRRDAAIEAGACSVDYTGTSKNLCYGQGVGGECFRCSGQVLKPDDVTKPTHHCELQCGLQFDG